jgi:hypothetical protein
MIDMLYLATTIAFFALMVGYVRFCATLGAAKDIEARHT